MTKIAVVLFNLGGPDSPQAVQPFLFNLFNDPAIIRVPRLLRYLIAKRISKKRAPIAKEIYSHMGGRSPILPETEAQAKELEKVLKQRGDVKVFICMRYWHPQSDEVVKSVKKFEPDEIILLPLYPQFSTTTTQSSFDEWDVAARRNNLYLKTTKRSSICCYPELKGLIDSQVALISPIYQQLIITHNVRILFSAHGLPERIVKSGDPYTFQIERTASKIVDTLNFEGLDWVLCYQSRVGPLKWVGPSTDDEIKRAGADGVSVIVVPIAFVSEHSETLVELDIEYKSLAESSGVPVYKRVPAVGCNDLFISSLAHMIETHLEKITTNQSVCSESRKKLCLINHKGCPIH